MPASDAAAASRGPARAARSRPGRRGCGRAARRRRRSARATSLEHGVPRLAGRRLRARARGARRSTRADDGLVDAERGHLRDDPRRRGSAEPSCSPWSTVTPTTRQRRLAAPRRPWRPAAPASRRRRSRRPAPGARLEVGERRGVRRAGRAATAGGASSRRRVSRARGATQASGSAISALEGRFAGLRPDGVEVRPCRPCRRRARTNAAPSRYCAILASRPSSRRSSRSRCRRPCGAG